jgi:hypothetical protein
MAGTLKFLHQLPIFTELVDQLAQSLNVNSYLIEKDYWLMHCLWGLQQQGWKFELKGGTSLSKGHAIIERFSEDIDIRFEPPADHALKTGKNHDKPAHIAARKDYFNWLAGQIQISGVIGVTRATDFDDTSYRNGGIVLSYPSVTQPLPGVKDGILLEVGFDLTAPNAPRTISSWAMDAALKAGLAVIDNRAVDVPCYALGYTLVESCKPSPPNTASSRRRATSPKTFCGTTTTFTACLSKPRCKPLSAARPTTHTSSYGSPKPTTSTSPATKPSCSVTPPYALCMSANTAKPLLSTTPAKFRLPPFLTASPSIGIASDHEQSQTQVLRTTSPQGLHRCRRGTRPLARVVRNGWFAGHRAQRKEG